MKIFPVLSALLAASAALTQAQTPVVAAGGVLNGASFDKTAGVTPGSLISIFGTNLAASTATADTIPLSNSLGNVTVSFNGIPAPLNGVFHDPTNGDQINAQLPWEITGPTADVVVTSGSVSSAPVTIPIAQFTPGIFSVQFGIGQAIAINLDGTLAAPAGSIPGLTTHPAKAGDMVELLATGLGPVDGTTPLADGDNTLDGLRNTVTKPTVTIGGVQALVPFSGLAPQFVGVNQVNITVQPGTPVGGAEPVQISMGGQTSTDKVTMAIGE